MISKAYRDELRKMHADSPRWGRGSVQHHNYIVTQNPATVLDYGCGKGGLVRELNASGIKCTGYDPGVPEFSKRPKGRYALVICADVLEHAEPEELDNVLADIAGFAERDIMLVIATRKAVAILPSGRNAHLIVANELFWIEQVSKHITINSYTYDGSELKVLACSK